MSAGYETDTKPKSALREAVETILFTLLIYAVIRIFLFENYRVVGRSMVPTLESEQFLIVNKLGYRLHDPRRGDIVVFLDPRTAGRKLIKRVVGLPGDVVEVKQGQVYINDTRIEEPYIENSGHYSEPPVTVPEGEYYVLGDNRNNSSDSHNWGTLPGENLVGKAWLTYWPPQLWGLIPEETYANLPD